MLGRWWGREHGWTWLESPPSLQQAGHPPRLSPGLHFLIKTTTEQQELKLKKSPGLMVGNISSPSNQVPRGRFSTKASASAPSPPPGMAKVASAWPFPRDRCHRATFLPPSPSVPVHRMAASLPSLAAPRRCMVGGVPCEEFGWVPCPVVPTPEQDPSSCPALPTGEGRLLCRWGGGQPILSQARWGRRVWDTCSARRADAR